MVTHKPLVEIITIGREILDGRVVDTNSIWIALQLRNIGLVVRHAQKVDDDLKRIEEAFQIASRRSNIIIVTGGLGPTSDDRTAEAFALFQHDELEFNKQAEELIRKYLQTRGKEVTLAQLKQAYMPKGVEVIPNPNGTAPAFCFQERTRQWFFLPGVPKEMMWLFQNVVTPMLPVDLGYRSYHWITQFTTESQLQEQLSTIEQSLPPGFETGYRTHFPENHVALYASCSSDEEAELFEKFKAQIMEVLEANCFSHGTNPTNLDEAVVELAIKKDIALAFVESCTGGLNSNRVTDVPGASAVLKVSWITYDNAAKVDLGVSEKIIQAHGAVSEECAKAMASAGLDRVQKLFPNKHCVCVSTTGIAGPTGATEKKPLGLCYAAVAVGDQTGNSKDLKCIKIDTSMDFGRSKNKLYFSQKSLVMLYEVLSSSNF